MADWKTLEEANAEYDKLADKISEMDKDAKEKQLELDALKGNASEDAKTAALKWHNKLRTYKLNLTKRKK